MFPPRIHQEFESTMISPTIFILNDDVLIEIFRHFVHACVSGYPDVYNNIWLIVQVCSTWRRLALEEPTLWAQINFGYLERRPQRLTELAFLRTKSARVSLLGDIRRSLEPLFFVTSHLRDQWSRVQTVDLIIRPELLKTNDIEYLREVWTRSAPNLTIFSVKTDRHEERNLRDDRPLRNPPLPIFTNAEAPALTEFCGDQFYLDLKEYRCFTSLSRLCIKAVRYTAIEVMGILTNIPSLVTLSLIFDLEMPTTMPEALPYVEPSNLRFIFITFYHGPIMPYVHILDHIRPRQRLILCFFCERQDLRGLVPASVSEIKTFQRVLNRFFASGLTTPIQQPISASIGLSPRFFSIRSTCDKLASFIFSINARRSEEPLSGPDISGILNLFATCDLSMIQTVSLGGKPDFHGQQAADYATGRFYKKLSGVKYLAVTPGDLPDLLDIDRNLDLSAVFPNIIGLELQVPLSYHEPWPSNLADYIPSSIRVVSLPDEARKDADFSSLDKRGNLTVVWDSGKYICGSGNPERLDFRERPTQISHEGPSEQIQSCSTMKLWGRRIVKFVSEKRSKR